MIFVKELHGKDFITSLHMPVTDNDKTILDSMNFIILEGDLHLAEAP